MKVSFIIPAHNREAYIEPAVRSLLRQSNDASLEIIVVDDGSTDGTANIVASLRESKPNIKLVSKTNCGVAAARNTGLDNVASDTDLIGFLDSDDLSMAGRFATEIPHFVKDPDLAFTYSRLIFSTDIDDKKLIPKDASHPIYGISLTTALFRKSVFDLVGRFDESFKQAEDLDFLLRLFEQPVKYLILDNISVVYRRHLDNATNNRREMSQYIKRALLLSAQRRRRNPALRNMPRFLNPAVSTNP